jgi:hypothetical protein
MTTAAPPRNYAERWLSFDDDKRLELAGTPERVAALDHLAALSAEERKPLAKPGRRRLRGAVARMNRAKRLYETTQAERNAFMIEQAILGEQQAKIADEAGVTAMIVSFALGTSTRSTWSRARANREAREAEEAADVSARADDLAS